MKCLAIAALGLVLAAPAMAQQINNSGPIAWVSSDVNPSTVFWIQGRFVPVDDPNLHFRGDTEVATIFCSTLERECLEIDSTSPFPNSEQAWVDEYKAISWDKDGIVATGRSLDGCTDETLKIRFKPPSVLLINSPVLPMPERCKKFNRALDKLMGKKGHTVRDQMEQDMLVPTRGPFPFQDWNPNIGKASAPQKKNSR